MSKSVLLGCLLFVTTASANAYQLQKVASGLGVPWAMVFVSETEILITERGGKIAIFDTVSGDISYITGAPKVTAKGQGGLLDVAKAPSYQTDNWLYFTYSKDIDNQSVLVLSRAHLKNKTLVDWQELLVTKSTSDTYQHFGSRIAFDDNFLYFSIGDRGVRKNAQDLKNHAGSILRLTYDGKIPKDNPFVNTKNALPEIWSYGHRNPQGLVWDAQNKRLWSIEHGPRGGDEINLIKKGVNYGWPIISYGKEYWGPFAVGEDTHKEGMAQPVKVYVPSIAPSSLLYYTGKAFPKWHGNLLAGALVLQHINKITLDEQGKVIKEKRLATELNERIRSLVQSPSGEVYFATDSGHIYLLSPK